MWAFVVIMLLVVLYAVYAEGRKAVGSIVWLQPDAFLRVVHDIEEPMVLRARRGRGQRLLVAHRGLSFVVDDKRREVELPPAVAVVEVDKIDLPYL